MADIRQERWETLQHNGPYFMVHQMLPGNIKFKYDGNEMDLSPDAEEMACLYAKICHLEYSWSDVFENNFFNDWRQVMTDEERETITDFYECSFKQISDYFNDENYKKEEREEKKRIEQEYGWCLWNGCKVEIQNYIIKPYLFRGRGDNPNDGRLVKVSHDDVIINGTLLPAPSNLGQRWKFVELRNNEWLASWTNNLGTKGYMRPKRTSKVVMENYKKKFDNVIELRKNKQAIINENFRYLTSPVNVWRQCAVAVYLMFKTGIRVGSTDSSEVRGCSTLRVGNIVLSGGKTVKLRFIGKSSRPYENEFDVEEIVYKHLESYKEDKNKEEKLFHLIDARKINEYLRMLDSRMTCKDIRTITACELFEEELEKTDGNSSEQDKIAHYKQALEQVQIFCNHMSGSTTIEHYLDPRITINWCEKHHIDATQVFGKSARKLFRWAFDEPRNFGISTELELQEESSDVDNDPENDILNDIYNYTYIDSDDEDN